jgi:hypothetical protein
VDDDRGLAPPERSSRRVLLERGWVVGVVLFTIGRFFVAYGALDRYGVNIWMFGFIDIVTAVPYGVSTARVVGALVDRRYQVATRWAFVAGATFIAPYLYLAWAGRDHDMPGVVYVVLGLLCVLFGANAIYGVIKKVRERKRDLPPPGDLALNASGR